MTEVCELRRQADLTQSEFAALLGVPINSFRMWDSGQRHVPAPTLCRARQIVAERARETELLPLARLASELGIHVQTLQGAVRNGRLQAHFSSRSVFGRPIRYATRAEGQRFKHTHYRQRSRQTPSAPLPAVPPNYDEQLKTLRRRLQLRQAALASLVGAAGKAVVYQWESRKRIPSPVFWQRIQDLQVDS